MSLFTRLSGVTGEDISTEILAHLLSSRESFFRFQRKFFKRVLKKPLSSGQLDAEAQTQVKLKAGRPDLIILSREFIVVLENKLGAYLSGDGQLVSYCDALGDKSFLRDNFPLRDLNVLRKKYFVFLAPRKTITSSRSPSDQVCKKEHGTNLSYFLKRKNINYVNLAWEDLIKYLDLTDSIQSELYLFIKDYIYQELTDGERKMLQNPQIPAAITKVFKRIKSLREDVSDNGWKVSRMTQSYNAYGFYIQPTKIKYLSFGYILELWEKHKTPIFMQINRDAIKKLHKRGMEKKLKENSFVWDKDYNWIRPFSIEDEEHWKEKLIESLQACFGWIRTKRPK